MFFSLDHAVPLHEWGLSGLPHANVSALSSTTECDLLSNSALHARLGHGSFGTVVEIRSPRYTHRSCAAKLFQNLPFSREDVKQALARAHHERSVVGPTLISPEEEDEIGSEDDRMRSSRLRLGKITHEAAMLHRVSPPCAAALGGSRHVLTYYGVCVIEHDTRMAVRSSPIVSTIGLLSECLHGGTLPTFVRHVSETASAPLAAIHIMTWFSQALQALAYLHDEQKCLHRDIKPANLLMRLAHVRTQACENEEMPNCVAFSITAENLDGAEVVLCDFGESVALSSLHGAHLQRSEEAKRDETLHPLHPPCAQTEQTFDKTAAAHTEAETEAAASITMRTVVGTEGYCAPEVASAWGCGSHSSYGRPADLWSLAASFYVLLVQGPAACAHGMAALLRSSANQPGKPRCALASPAHSDEDQSRCGPPPSPHEVNTMNTHVATLLIACGAYPSLQTLFSDSGAPAGKRISPFEAEECSSSGGTPARRSTRLPTRPWSWAPSQTEHGTTSDDAHGHTEDEDTYTSTSTMTVNEVNPLGLVLSPSLICSAAPAPPSDVALEVRKRWCQRVLDIEGMSEHLATHHGGKKNQRTSRAQGVMEATFSGASLLSDVQTRLSAAFMNAVDALMCADPRQRPSARQALTRFASLHVHCGGVTVVKTARDDSCGGTHKPYSRLPIWSDAHDFVLSLVVAHRYIAWPEKTICSSAAAAMSVSEHEVKVWRMLKDASLPWVLATGTQDLSCAALWFRSPCVRAESEAAAPPPSSRLSAFLSHRADCLENSHVLLITVGWLCVVKDDEQMLGTAEALEHTLAERIRVRCGECTASDVAWSAMWTSEETETSAHVNAPSQTLLGSGVHVSAVAADAVAARHASEMLSPSSTTTGAEEDSSSRTASVSFHCEWHLLYALSRPTASASRPLHHEQQQQLQHPINIASARQYLIANCGNVRSALISLEHSHSNNAQQVEVTATATTTMATMASLVKNESPGDARQRHSWEAEMLSTQKMILSDWQEQLKTTCAFLERATKTDQCASSIVFYLDAPPSAEAMLDVLFSSCGGDIHGGDGGIMNFPCALEAFVRDWLSHAPYMVACPC